MYYQVSFNDNHILFHLRDKVNDAWQVLKPFLNEGPGKVKVSRLYFCNILVTFFTLFSGKKCLPKSNSTHV